MEEKYIFTKKEKEKDNFKWYKDNIDRLDKKHSAFLNNSLQRFYKKDKTTYTTNSRRKEINILFDLYNNIIDIKDFNDVCKIDNFYDLKEEDLKNITTPLVIEIFVLQK